ncbi:LXG domain-containing protein [Bacillus cereus]|nr:LXG domain-containing protein [Bacillus cereus]UYY94824.1 LXG domain-containing protein [Bacillus cereus]
MSLNMYLGEVQGQTQSMNAVCNATIQGMEQVIQSIDAFAIDTVLQGQTYSSAKSFFVQTFRPLAQGIIYLCEELIRQNDAFPSQFQSQVASTDVIEQEILEQIREIDRMKASMEAISQAMPIPGMDAMANLFTVMRKKLQEKLDHLYQFNQTSSNNYSTALQLAASIAAGLAEVQSGKGFSPASGTFSTQGLNMEWTTSIQAINEDRKRQADNHLNGSSIEEGTMCGPLNSEKKDESLLDTFKHGVEDIYEGALEFIQGAGSAVAEDYIGLTPLDNDKLESKATYQAGRFTGHVISTAGSIVEIFEGISVIGGANFLTFVAEVGSGGLASPIVLPLDAVATVAGVGVVVHGGLVWDKSIQNAKDTLQKFESSPSSGERINKVKENGKLNKEENATKGMDNTSNKTSGDNPKVIEELEGPVIDGKRVGSGEKIDKVKPIWGRDEKGKPIIVKEFPHVPKEHGFSDIVDNYSRFADEFPLVGGDRISRRFFQIEGSNGGKKGVFEWIVEPNGNVSHRRFIENGTVTGKPNQVPKKVKGELYGFNRF